jgi:hypothetical protein
VVVVAQQNVFEILHRKRSVSIHRQVDWSIYRKEALTVLYVCVCVCVFLVSYLLVGF